MNSVDRPMTQDIIGTRRRRLGIVGLLALPVYALSSGPVVATAFWLREATGVNAFYCVVWLYYPMLVFPRWLWDPYVSWWVSLFGTVGPG